MNYQDELDAKAAAVLEQMRKQSELSWRAIVRFLIGLAVAIVVYVLTLWAAGWIFHNLSRWL